ncbi:MAG: hypothetical protein PHY47_26915 [Lachnospiraceae bacterium]|nr:hypothetical protein [Lachnospiraceae bacterium]
MNYQNVIDYKLQMLIDLMMTDGVSPSDLASNIFERDYVNISFTKKNNLVIGKLEFYENGNLLQNIQMFYTYTLDRQLVEIEENIGGDRVVLWNRENREEDLIKELLYIMSCCYDNEQIESFISTLPDILKKKVKYYLFSLSA